MDSGDGGQTTPGDGDRQQNFLFQTQLLFLPFSEFAENVFPGADNSDQSLSPRTGPWGWGTTGPSFAGWLGRCQDDNLPQLLVADATPGSPAGDPGFPPEAVGGQGAGQGWDPVPPPPGWAFSSADESQVPAGGLSPVCGVRPVGGVHPVSGVRRSAGCARSVGCALLVGCARSAGWLFLPAFGAAEPRTVHDSRQPPGHVPESWCLCPLPPCALRVLAPQRRAAPVPAGLAWPVRGVTAVQLTPRGGAHETAGLCCSQHPQPADTSGFLGMKTKDVGSPSPHGSQDSRQQEALPSRCCLRSLPLLAPCAQVDSLTWSVPQFIV